MDNKTIQFYQNGDPAYTTPLTLDIVEGTVLYPSISLIEYPDKIATKFNMKAPKPK